MITVASVALDSVGAELGLTPGAELLAVNGRELTDFLDWEFLTAEDRFELEARMPNGEHVVFDIERPGQNTENCGSEFDLVEKIEPGEIRTYAMDQLSAYVARLNENAPQGKETTVEKVWERNPWEPHNFEELIQPRPIDELRKMFSKRGSNKDEGKSEGKGDDGGDESDDIPY